MMIRLRGLTWDHERGQGPLAAAAGTFEQSHPGVAIDWETRPLPGSAAEACEMLAGDHDLLVVEHPCIGLAHRHGLLLPLDEPARAAELEALARHSIGLSHASYQFAGRQWALAIDAAAQTACYRPDRLERTPSRWAEVIALAEAGRVLWPLRPADALASFFSLAANIGHPAAAGTGRFIDADAGRQVLKAMRAVARHLPAACFEWGPLQTLEALALPTQQAAYCPLIFSFSNYSRSRYRPKRVAFTDMPGLGDQGPRGATLGGFGIAVSARTPHPAPACAFAFHAASEAVQRSVHVDHMGQPAHALAWSDEHANQLCTHFFRMTRRTTELSWLRPRDAGFLAASEAAGEIVHAFLRGEGDEEDALLRLAAIPFETASKSGLDGKEALACGAAQPQGVTMSK